MHFPSNFIAPGIMIEDYTVLNTFTLTGIWSDLFCLHSQGFLASLFWNIPEYYQKRPLFSVICKLMRTFAVGFLLLISLKNWLLRDLSFKCSSKFLLWSPVSSGLGFSGMRLCRILGTYSTLLWSYSCKKCNTKKQNRNF